MGLPGRHQEMTVIAPLLALVPLCLLPGLETRLGDRSRLARDTALELGVERVDLVRLGSLELSGEELRVPVLHEGRVRELRLEPHSVRAPGFRVRVWTPDGVVETEPAPVRTYRGFVEGEADTVVLASLDERGLTARVQEGDVSWRVEPTRREGWHAVFDEEHGDHMPAPCGTELLLASADPKPAPIKPYAQQPWQCMQLATVAFDVDFEYFQAKGSSIPTTVAAIEAIVDQVDYFYARDIHITLQLTDVIVRTAPFYAPVDGGDLLDDFRAEWNANQQDVVRDMAHLMTGKPGSLVEFGGLAWVGATCNKGLAYGWSMDGANIVGHEMGHNLGAGHCADPSPCNNMCGACFYVGPNTRRIKESYLAGTNCLDTVGFYETPLPPYAFPDELSLRKDEYDGLGTVVFDVLANDSDGNCDPLHIQSFEAVSERGGTVYQVGQRLFYDAPADPFVGEDVFHYVVADGTGKKKQGAARVTVRSLELRGYWELDDGAGDVAAESTPSQNAGDVEGAAVWTSGVLGTGALEFDGNDDAVAIPALNLNSDQVTITGWMKRPSAQNATAGVVFSRDGSTTAGLNFFDQNKLGYHWNGAANTYTWNSGVKVFIGTWTFFALVVEPDRATIYAHDGSLRKATNFVDHGVEAFDGVTYLGWEPGSEARRFQGELDDVRIYGYALSETELLELIESGGRADAPLPGDGGRLAEAGAALQWLPGLQADSHDVYFGTSYVDVRDGGTLSASYLGNVLDPEVVAPGVIAGTEYFWRVDERVGPQTLPGPVWQFRLAEYGRWPFEEVAGSVADDANGTDDGTYVNGPVLGQPGATPSTGFSVLLDGANDYVRIPALDLNSDRVTITTWLRRQGSQSSFAGIVFNRNGSTVAGLNFGEGNELRYHWNGGGETWGWDSGLVVPNDEWVFAALVVEPTRASIYLGESGVLTRADNHVSHAPEEFDGNTNVGRDKAGNRYFGGFIDDVRIYDAALAPAQVEVLYLGSL